MTHKKEQGVPTQQVQVTPRTDLRSRIEQMRATLAGLSLPLGSTREVAKHERDTALALIDEVLEAEAARSVPVAEGLRLIRRVRIEVNEAMGWLEQRVDDYYVEQARTHLEHALNAIAATPPDPAEDELHLAGPSAWADLDDGTDPEGKAAAEKYVESIGPAEGQEPTVIDVNEERGAHPLSRRITQSEGRGARRKGAGEPEVGER